MGRSKGSCAAHSNVFRAWIGFLCSINETCSPSCSSGIRKDHYESAGIEELARYLRVSWLDINPKCGLDTNCAAGAICAHNYLIRGLLHHSLSDRMVTRILPEKISMQNVSKAISWAIVWQSRTGLSAISIQVLSLISGDASNPIERPGSSRSKRYLWGSGL